MGQVRITRIQSSRRRAQGRVVFTRSSAGLRRQSRVASTTGRQQAVPRVGRPGVFPRGSRRNRIGRSR